ncbi:abl interactor 1-like isoform X4 [Bolinopsis microptera]|uniref:abl interactor 1-like isoform X4 n=1 Tax=Bolinopsis microptera TaxID=2820187 RepID=UPI0030794356
MMVSKDEEEQVCEVESEDCTTNGVDQPLPNKDVVFVNAAEEIPEYRKQLLLAKDEMANVADMYQQDYLDKVEHRVDLAKEARSKAVSCLVDVSKRIYNLAGCFQQLLDDQVDKLQEIENMTVTASASLEISSCYSLRNELHLRFPAAHLTNSQPRLTLPDNNTLPNNEFLGRKNVIWEKLNYNKYDRLGAGLNEFDGADEESMYVEPSVPKSRSQQSLQSTGSSNKSFVTATSALSPVPNSNHSSLQARDTRLSASSIDIRQPKSPALNRYGSLTSLTSLNSSKSDTKSSGAPASSKPVATVKRSLSSLKLQPHRAAPAPPPAKQYTTRNRVYSVKNETGEGLEKPSIPAPRPPPVFEEEDHYAIPPQHRMPTLSEERGTPTPTAPDEVIYDDVRTRGAPTAAVPAAPVAPPLPQYQTIAVAAPAPVPDNEYPEDDDIYMDMDEIDSCPPTPTPPPSTPPSVTSPTTPAEDLYLSPGAGLFGGPKSPGLSRVRCNTGDGLFGGPKSTVVTHYKKKSLNAGPLIIAPPDTIPEDSDSEFDDEDYDAEVEDDEDIYQDVDNIYDAPSLRCSSLMTSDEVTSPISLPSPLSTPFRPLEEEDDLYIDNELLPPPAPSDLPPPDDLPSPFDDGALPPPPPDILPPPYPDEDEELYADMYPVQDGDDIYTDNTIDNHDMVNTHTVSVSKDSGFYTEDQEEEDPVIEKVQVIFPYAATASDELNLNPGDIVSVHVKNPDGWYEGSLNGVRGLFPGNYVESAE